MAKKTKENGTSQEKKILLSIVLHTQKHNVLFIWLSFLNELSYNNELGPNHLHFSRCTSKKRKLKSDRDYGSYDYKRVSVYLCPS